MGEEYGSGALKQPQSRCQRARITLRLGTDHDDRNHLRLDHHRHLSKTGAAATWGSLGRRRMLGLGEEER